MTIVIRLIQMSCSSYHMSRNNILYCTIHNLYAIEVKWNKKQLSLYYCFRTFPTFKQNCNNQIVFLPYISTNICTSHKSTTVNNQHKRETQIAKTIIQTLTNKKSKRLKNNASLLRGRNHCSTILNSEGINQRYSEGISKK